MRSIHKKTLKRFLSTLLAVVMVLGMVPFTALAAPANGYNLTVTAPDYVAVGQTVDASSTLTGLAGASPYNAYVKIEVTSPASANPKILATDTTSGIVYNLAATTTAGTVDTDGTVSSGGMWGPSTGFPVSADYSATTPLTLKFDVPGNYTATFKLIDVATSSEICSGTKTITVVGFTSLAASSPNPQIGTDFTVTAATTATSGVVQFSYGSQTRTAAVGTDGKATAAFTAEANQTAVVAILSGISGVDAVTATTTITLGAADTYYDVTFLPGAADAYIPFTPTTVSVKSGESYPLPTAIPTREGYTFKGWDKDGNGTADYAAGASIPIADITADMTLNAVWEETKYTINYHRVGASTAADYTTPKTIEAAVGETVYFGVTVPDGYDASTMTVAAEGASILAPYSSFSGTNDTTYYYSFVLTQNMTSGGSADVVFTGPSKLTYTVMMPVGHFTAKITAANGTDITPAASASVEYGKGYTFTVTPATGYEIKGVYVNGAVQTADSTGADGTQTFIVTDVTSAQTVEVVVDAVPSYTVTYVVNDAQYTTQKVTSGSTIGTLPDDPVVDGYTFDSWNTKQNGSGTKLAATTTVSQDMTVYAQLTPVSYTITYKDGTSVLDTQTKTHGVASSLSADVPTKAGHTFLGWGTTAAATTATYQPGDMYSTEGSITLYAVWKIDTFTVTLPNGTGYTAMPATGSSSPVDYGKNFTFTVTVDPEYAVTKPTVKVGNTDVTNSLSGSNPYTYTINNITADQVVSIQVTRNPVYTVTFQYTLPGSSTPTVYQTQQVEYGAKATQPAPPSVEGYTFGGWYNGTTAYDFATPVTDNLTLTAKMTAITPKVEWTASGTGWTLDVTNPSTLTSGGTVAYKSSVEFTVTIAAGYDATNLAVAANGLALAPVEVNGNIYKFVLPNITADQKITVTGVARKMITITYNDNGGIGGPGQEQVKYYLSDTDCGEISTVKPTRVGYEFLGWATTNNATAPAYSNPAKTTPVTSKIANFTTDTTLYAVWSAKTTTVTLTVDKTSQYEGEKVVLTADVKSGTAAVTSGSVQFYRSNNGATPAELVGTAKVSGGKAVLTIATSAYKRDEANTDSYTVKFIPDEGSGYSEATSSPAVTVTVLSTAISWKLNASSEVDTKANVLKVYKYSATAVGNKGDEVTNGVMTAGSSYILELPAIYALDNQATALTVNKDYTVIWQYLDGANGWQTYTEAQEGNTVKILPDFAKYQFRAMVKPLTGATGHFTQAAKYNAATTGTPATLIADQYVEYLLTEATPAVAQQETATSLAVTDTHDLTSGTAEFEGQKVTLTATVVLKDTTTKVTTGEVYFYNGATLIGKADVQSDGTAVLEATISEYNRAVTDQKDTFKAVYQDNATYKTSTSNEELVRIRSTAIAWAGSKVLTVYPTGAIYADNQYTLTLPAIKEEGQDVTLTVGTDYVVSWYMVKADKTVVLLAENTQSNTYTVVPPTAGVTYYAVVSPKAGSNYTDAYEGGETKNFLTSEKTAASVQSPTITTITFGEVLTDTGKTPDFSQYEEKTITITAKVVEADLTTPTTAKTPEEVVKSGTVTFYVVTKSDGTYEKISTATVSDGLATVSYTLPEYDLADALSNIEYIFAVYTDTDNTYATSNTTSETTIGARLTTDKIDKETEAVQILSTSISWKLDGSNKIVATPDANKLKVYTAVDNGNKGTEVTDGKMTAGSSYVLELPAVCALDGAQAATTALTVNKDYKVTWQFREYGTSQWADYPNASAGNTVLITPDYSGYQFQAVVKPIYDNEALTGYKTAAAYGTGDVVNGKTDFLFTDPTEKTKLQATTTVLDITGADNEGSVTIAGTNVTTGLAQFEGLKVTLKATVTDNSTSEGVLSGYVKFYRYVDGTGTGDELLNTTQVAVDQHGIATFDVTIKDYADAGEENATEIQNNVDKFYAVYEENATYATSNSVADPDVVYIKSTKIQTPIIDSARANADGKTATTYTADLTGLLAGVEHTFTLRTGNAAADWSVVALDGRTVAAKNYDIQWNVKTGDNTVTDDAVGGTFTTSNNKVGDEISVTLIAKNDMKVGNTSKKAIIGTKQDVNVTVTAEDKITSTPETDVYQLNEIKLTATVAAAEGANATVKPTGTVTFYYSVDNGSTWTKVGETTDLAEVAGVMTASIKTTELPVDATTNKQQNVTITAIYSGDETFNKSGTIDTNSAITDTTGCTVTDETVTVYSSVVYVNSGVENKAINPVSQSHASGIYIYAEEDKVLANEANVNLMLSDVYTLDHDIPLSKLTDGTEADYTVQWQKLTNAQVEEYRNNYAAAPWQNIEGKTGTICQITVKQGAAYRAMITVNNTPIAKGSYTEVDQDIDGRRVYYSNILVANPAPPTVTVNVNTSNTTDGYEGIVEGETVTIHTFASGASGTTPISELTVTITDASDAEVDKQVKTNVNGHVSFDWTAADPGYYTLKVVAKFTNGYSDKEITRTLIVRDDNYDFTVSNTNPTYNGKVQGLTVTVDNMGIESDLAQKSVVVYYYTDANRTQQVEPTQAGTYYATIRLQESAYWTEKTMDTTFTIEQREVEIDDVIVQAKVYNGSDSANVQEIILKDAETYQDSTGLPKNNTGVINGDSVYAIGTAVTNSANVNEATQVTVTVTLPLLGDDAANYTLVNNTYTEDFTIQRSQVKGDIANSTFKYTGSNITVPADDIYLIDQAGNKLSNYTVTYYYHNGDGVEKVDAMNKLGKYTVIARPEQNNYKGGASQTVYVVEGAGTDATPTAPTSALIDITNTVELFGATTGIKADIKPSIPANGATITKIEYQNGTGWTETVPTDAGRYLVKVTTDTSDTAYGIYTIVKARPALELSATGAEYTSAQISGTPTGTFNGAAFPTGTYFTYAGGTIQGVAYEAPTEVGTYIVTAHVPETDNYTAHEISYQFKITPKALKITADSLQRRQYGAFPDMTASFDGLADSAYAPDTSLRDVQIQPELIFNETDGYDNIAMDHVGNEYPIIAIAALARNYDVSYVNGNLSVTRDEPNPYLAIHGMIDNGNGGDIAYYGDVIQLYAYGSQSKTTGVINNSSVLTWSSSDNTKFPVTQDGLLTINGVGTFTVTLTRGIGAQKISTTLTIEAKPKEVKVNVPDVDKVYTASEQTYNGTVTVEGLINSDTDAATLVAGNKRTNVGSQITTYKVDTAKYVSETYGGLFTINDKEATVTPGAQTTVYGTAETYDETKYTVDGIVGGVDPVTGVNVASVVDAYANLDVLDGYEILVAGVENMNYNVKYVTDQDAPDAQVTAKSLIFKTGVIDSDGRTSGYMESNSLFFEDAGYAITGTSFNTTPNDRMYGEINPVMDYLFDALIAGDSEADLVSLLDWLVEYSDGTAHNINGNANVKFDKTQHLAGYRATTAAEFISGAVNNYVIDGMLGTAGVKNYTTTVTEATQNIYQRPVTLALKDSQTKLDVYIEDAKNDTILMNIIKQNLEVSGYTYGSVEYGGLAEKLGHTMENLQLAITHKTVDHSGDYIVHVKVGNPNYWLSNTCTDSCAASGSCGHSAETFSVKIHVTTDSIKVVYNEPNALGWTSASVVMHKMPEDQPVNLSADSKVYFAIYEDKGEGYDYSGETKIRSGWMNRASQTGVWTCTYSRLTAGNYRIFAIPVGDYTIINSGNVPVPAYPNP